jgi:hypothetical protein
MVTDMPAGLYQDWHPASRRHFLLVLSGAREVETSDGMKHRCDSGEVFLTDDVGSRGHRTRTIAGGVVCASASRSQDRLSIAMARAELTDLPAIGSSRNRQGDEPGQISNVANYNVQLPGKRRH